MKKILITGGFGFLGGHLIEKLLQCNTNLIHVVDSMVTSPIPLEYFLAYLKNPKNLSYSICTVANYFSAKDIVKYDEVYHLASPVGPAGVLNHAGEMVRAVVADTYLVADYCKKIGARLLNVSTSEVYGGGQEGYCNEAMYKIVPAKMTVRLEYAVAKLAAETALMNMSRVKGLEVVIVRPFNVAGPRQSSRGGFVLPRFIQQADEGQPLTVFGDGNAVRAFSHVRDLVAGFELALKYGRSGEAYNIGNPKNKISVLELAKTVIKLLKSKSEIIFVDPKAIYGPLFDEANDKFPDSEKAKEELGWIPEHGIEAVIIDAYEEYLAQKKAGLIMTGEAKNN